MEPDWIVSSLSQGLPTPSVKSDTAGIAKLRLHWSTTGFVLQASLMILWSGWVQGSPVQSGDLHTLGLLSQGFTARGWACFVSKVWGSLCNSSPGVICICVGACVGCVLVNWMCSQRAGSTPRGATRSLASGWTWPMYMAPWATCSPLQRLSQFPEH